MRDVVELALGVVLIAVGCYLIYCRVKLSQTRALGHYLPRILPAALAALVLIAVAMRY